MSKCWSLTTYLDVFLNFAVERVSMCLQVRAKALKALNWAHTVGPRSTAFPLEDVVRMLMFCSAAEATDFIQQYGINVNDGYVIFRV